MAAQLRIRSIPMSPSWALPNNFSNFPTRSISVSLAPSSINESDLYTSFECFGKVRGVEVISFDYGRVIVHFYDSRGAEAAFTAVRNHIYIQHYPFPNISASPLPPPLARVIIWAFYIISDVENEATLVVFKSVSLKVFQRFGPIKSVRHAQNKNCTFIEYFDIRDARNALQRLNGKKVDGDLLRVEFSTPRVINDFDSNLTLSVSSEVEENEGRKSTGQRKQADKGKQETHVIEDASKEESKSKTTLMIKNIPNRYSIELMLDMLDKHCLHSNKEIGDGEPPSSFDFFYLPRDFNNNCNLGYAFVNMTSPEAAERLNKALHNKAWARFNSKKICEVKYAFVQGLEALEGHFRSKLMHEREHYLPMVFSPPRDGTQLTEPVAVSVGENIVKIGTNLVDCSPYL